MPVIDANGARIPLVGLGTWDLRGRTCVRMVEEAIRIGYRHIDTASMYGNEAAVAVRHRRADQAVAGGRVVHEQTAAEEVRDRDDIHGDAVGRHFDTRGARREARDDGTGRRVDGRDCAGGRCSSRGFAAT